MDINEPAPTQEPDLEEDEFMQRLLRKQHKWQQQHLDEEEQNADRLEKQQKGKQACEKIEDPMLWQKLADGNSPHNAHTSPTPWAATGHVPFKTVPPPNGPQLPARHALPRFEPTPYLPPDISRLQDAALKVGSNHLMFDPVACTTLNRWGWYCLCCLKGAG